MNEVDLGKAAFGLGPFNRHQDVMFGRKIDEITFQSTCPDGSALTLIKYLDSTVASAGESAQGFTTSRSITESGLSRIT